MQAFHFQKRLFEYQANKPLIIIIMSNKISQSIKIIDFRNTRYQGSINEYQEFDGIGILLDDEFSFILAQWRNGVIDGPCFIMFPNEQIFYGNFRNGNVDGLCCFDTTDACKIFCNFKNGRNVGDAASIFDGIDYIVHISISEQGAVNVIEQINYGEQVSIMKEGYKQELEKKKWDITEDIVKARISEDQKQLKKFIKDRLIERHDEELEIFQVPSSKDEFFFGFKGEGFGIKFEEDKLKSVGHYSDAKVMSLMGKKIINRIKQVREEGLYHIPETLLRYQHLDKRPKQTRKNLRDFYRKSLNFNNKFYSLEILGNLNNLFNKIKVNIKENTIQKIAQQLLENPVPIEVAQTYHAHKNQQPIDRREIRKTPPKQSLKSNPSPREEVSLQRLKQELNKTAGKKNNTSFHDRSFNQDRSKSKSPYKIYDQPPAELKYISTSQINDKDTNKTPPKEYRNDRNDRIAHELSSLNIQTSSFASTTPRKTGIIKQNRSKSPIDNSYQGYGSRNINYEREKHPNRIYSNLELQEDRAYQKGTTNKYSGNNRVDEMSNLYDNLQTKEERLQAYNKLQQKNKNSRRDYRQYLDEDDCKRPFKSPARTQNRKYNINDHQFRENPEMNGIKYSTSRKVEVPERYESPYDKNKRKYNADTYDRTSSYYHYKNRHI